RLIEQSQHSLVSLGLVASLVRGVVLDGDEPVRSAGVVDEVVALCRAAPILGRRQLPRLPSLVEYRVGRYWEDRPSRPELPLDAPLKMQPRVRPLSVGSAPTRRCGMKGRYAHPHLPRTHPGPVAIPDTTASAVAIHDPATGRTWPQR